MPMLQHVAEFPGTIYFSMQHNYSFRWRKQEEEEEEKREDEGGGGGHSLSSSLFLSLSLSYSPYESAATQMTRLHLKSRALDMVEIPDGRR